MPHADRPLKDLRINNTVYQVREQTEKDVLAIVKAQSASCAQLPGETSSKELEQYKEVAVERLARIEAQDKRIMELEKELEKAIKTIGELKTKVA